MPSGLGLSIVVALKNFFSPKAKEVSESMKTVSKDADKTVGSLKKMQAAIQGLAGQQIFVKAEASLREMVGPAAQFQEQLAMIRTLTGTTVEQTEALGISIRNLGKEFGTTALEQSAGVFQLLDDGIDDANDSLLIMEAANKLVVAGGVDMGTAVKAMTDSFNAYGYSAKDAAHVANVFQLTNVKGATSVAAVARFMQNAAPTAENLGIKLEELAAIIATMTGAGVKTQTGFKAIEMVMNNVYANADKLDPVLKRLKLGSLKDIMAKAPDKGGGLVSMIQALVKSGPSGMKALEDIGIKGKALQNFMKVTGSGFDTYSKNLQAMLHDTDTLNNQYGIATDTPIFRWKKLKAMIEDTKLELGQRFLNAMVPVLDKMNQYAKALSEWVQKHPEATKAIALVIAGLTGLAMALGIAAVAMGVLSFISWPVVIALGTIGAAIAGVLMWVFKWEEALTSVTGAFENMFLGVEERVETFAEFFKSVWEGMKVAAQEIWNGIASHFKSVWAASVNDFKSIWHSATGFFSGIWITTASIFRGIWNSIAGFFRGIWNSISSFITGVWNRIVSFLTEKWNSWTQSFSNATRIITDVLSGVGNSAYEVFNSMFIEPIKTIISYIQQAIEWIGNLGKAMSEAFESIQLPSFITEAFSSVGNIAIPGQGRGPLAPIARTMPLRQPQASAPYDTQSPVQRREVQQNTSLSAVRNPAAAAVKTGPTNITVNVPKAEIRSAPVMLDKSKIGEVVMQMIQLSTVRATE